MDGMKKPKPVTAKIGSTFPTASTPRSRNVSGDQSNVQKVYRWVRQNWSKPGPYGK